MSYAVGSRYVSAYGTHRATAQHREDAFTTPESAGQDFAIQGEYIGEINGKGKVAAQVVAEGDGKFVVQFLSGGLPGGGWDGTSKLAASARTANGKTTVRGDGASGEIVDGELTGRDEGGPSFCSRRMNAFCSIVGSKLIDPH